MLASHRAGRPHRRGPAEVALIVSPSFQVRGGRCQPPSSKLATGDADVCSVRHGDSNGDQISRRCSTARSIRLSGMSHRTATSTYSASASDWLTNAMPMGAARRPCSTQSLHPTSTGMDEAARPTTAAGIAALLKRKNERELLEMDDAVTRDNDVIAWK